MVPITAKYYLGAKCPMWSIFRGQMKRQSDYVPLVHSGARPEFNHWLDQCISAIYCSMRKILVLYIAIMLVVQVSELAHESQKSAAALQTTRAKLESYVDSCSFCHQSQCVCVCVCSDMSSFSEEMEQKEREHKTEVEAMTNNRAMLEVWPQPTHTLWTSASVKSLMFTGKVSQIQQWADITKEYTAEVFSWLHVVHFKLLYWSREQELSGRLRESSPIGQYLLPLWICSVYCLSACASSLY